MKERARKLWMGISLKKKLGIFAVMIVFVMGLSGVSDIVAMDLVVQSFDRILDDDSRCNDMQVAMELETEAFAAYVRDRSEENGEAYRLSCVRSERCLAALPFDYGQIGSERYARTWNVKNGYENYTIRRDQVLGMARLETAETTGRMIDSLGSLFRYDLKMSEQVVMLERELKVVEDYMFIQQMCFGGRVVYGSQLELDQGGRDDPSLYLTAAGGKCGHLRGGYGSRYEPGTV